MSAAPAFEVRVEPMSDSHLPRVLEIERDVFADPWSEGSFRAEIRDSRVSFTRVALTYPEGEVLGYFVAWFIEDEVHLGNLAVAAEAQGRGTGQKLLDYLMESSRERGAKVVTLEVRESNLKAQRLYLKNGFRPVAIRRRYYPDNKEDAIVMQVDL